LPQLYFSPSRQGGILPAPCNACPVEFPDFSGTPLACPGATTREHDPVWEKTREFVPLNPILADQVWARGIQQGEPISLGLRTSNMRFFKSSTKLGLVELFYVYLCGAPRACRPRADLSASGGKSRGATWFRRFASRTAGLSGTTSRP